MRNVHGAVFEEMCSRLNILVTGATENPGILMGDVANEVAVQLSMPMWRDMSDEIWARLADSRSVV